MTKQEGMIVFSKDLYTEINELGEESRIQLIFTKGLLTAISNGVRTLHPITEQTEVVDLRKIIADHKQERAKQSPLLFGSKEGKEI